MGYVPARFRLVAVGNASVGKTCLLKRWVDGTYDDITRGTVGVDYFKKDVKIGEMDVGFNVWDTAGAEQYRSLTATFLRGSHAVLLVFAINDRQSFEDTRGWHSTVIDELGVGHCQFALVGSKGDLIDTRVVSVEDGDAMARELQMEYFEVSAKTGEGVEALFTSLTRIAYFAHANPVHGKKVELNAGGERNGGECGC